VLLILVLAFAPANRGFGQMTLSYFRIAERVAVTASDVIIGVDEPPAQEVFWTTNAFSFEGGGPLPLLLRTIPPDAGLATNTGRLPPGNYRLMADFAFYDLASDGATASSTAAYWVRLEVMPILPTTAIVGDQSNATVPVADQQRFYRLVAQGP
jgi:hypothetical protein